MSMIAGGDDGSEKAARGLARRPTIRPRPVTPPRSTATATAAATAPAPAKAHTWKLPPVRLPSPRIAGARPEVRAAARPVLLLVADASDQFEIARRHESADAGSSARRWDSLRPVTTRTTLAIIAASAVVVLALAAVVGTRASSRASAASPRVATRAIAPATTPSPPAAKVAEVALPVIPLVDVKSLPAAPSKR